MLVAGPEMVEGGDGLRDVAEGRRFAREVTALGGEVEGPGGLGAMGR